MILSCKMSRIQVVACVFVQILVTSTGFTLVAPPNRGRSVVVGSRARMPPSRIMISLQASTDPEADAFDTNSMIKRLEELEKQVAIQARMIKTLQAKTINVKVQKEKGENSVTLTPEKIQNGSVAACTLIGMIIGKSVSSNLWLVGAAAGAYFGTITAKQSGLIGVRVRKLGVWVALRYIDVAKFYQDTVYLYKTGVLGATYYKKFEELDKQYKIVDKYESAVAKIQGEYAKVDREFDITEKSRNLIVWARGAADDTMKQIQTYDRKKKLTDRLPVQIRGLFKSKKEYREEMLKEYRVGFMGQRKWRPFP